MASTSPITLHYFDIEGVRPTAFLGENINLFLKDAGVDFKYLRHKREEWPAIKEDLAKNKKIGHPTMPFIEIDGKVLPKTAPILRHLSRKFGKYNGSNEDEAFFVDTVADSVRDHWESASSLFGVTDEEKLKEHATKNTTKFMNAYNQIYGQIEGPYILGDKISYADFLVYHVIDDDNAMKLLKDYPNVAKFVEAFTQRSNLANYLTSLKK